MARSRSAKRAGRPPEGEPWVWHTCELLCSEAWRGCSINDRRVLDYLETEHMRHGGVENGSLLAPYTALKEYGISRRLIAAAIRDLEARGLISVERGGKKGTQMTEVSRYRLTYLWARIRKDGLWEWLEPSNEWKSYSEPEIGPTSGTALAPQRELAGAPEEEPASSQVTDFPSQGVAPQKEPPSRSRGRRKANAIREWKLQCQTEFSAFAYDDLDDVLRTASDVAQRLGLGAESHSHLWDLKGSELASLQHVLTINPESADALRAEILKQMKGQP